MQGIIYLITNKQTGYKYIGQTTKTMNKRWQEHIQESMRMSPKPLHSAMRKYGNHNFMIKQIDECNESLLEEKANYWIKQHNPEYNITKKEIIEIVEEEELPPPIKKLPQKEYKSWGYLTEENRGNGKHCGLAIRGKNLKTGICTDYENARMAASSVTGDPKKNSNILLAARKGGTAYGHKWQILEEKSKKKSVFGVNKKTGEIGIRFESITEAIRELGDSGKGAGLIKSLKNPGHYSWKGYWWFYAR